MQLLALLLIPWAVFSPMFVVAIYLYGLTVDAFLVSCLFILLSLVVNIKTIGRTRDISRSSRTPTHQSPDWPQTANLDRRPD